MGSGARGRTGLYRGSSRSDDCDVEEYNVEVDEVTNCPYYQDHSSLPEVGAEITIGSELYKKRLPVLIDGEVLGVLPPRFSRILKCFTRGYRYTGSIQVAKRGEIPEVQISIRTILPK